MFSSGKDWNDAKADCASPANSAVLCEASTAAEYNILQQFFKNLGKNLWVGAFATGSPPGPFPFKWIDGTSLPTSSTWWCSGEPNNWPKGVSWSSLLEGCVTMWSNSASSACFNDFSCSNSLSYCCEKV